VYREVYADVNGIPCIRHDIIIVIITPARKSLSPEALKPLLCTDSSRDKYGSNEHSTDESESSNPADDADFD